MYVASLLIVEPPAPFISKVHVYYRRVPSWHYLQLEMLPSSFPPSLRLPYLARKSEVESFVALIFRRSQILRLLIRRHLVPDLVSLLVDGGVK